MPPPPRRLCRRPQLGCLIALVAGKQHPGDAGGLVGQGDGGHLGRLAGDEVGQPRQVRGASTLGMADHRHGAGHQQPSEILIALLGDAPEPLLAAGGALPGHSSYPCRQRTPIYVRCWRLSGPIQVESGRSGYWFGRASK